MNKASFKRLVHISFIAVTHGSRLLYNRVLSKLSGMPMETGPELLRNFIEDLGGSFLKFGQMLALQPDIIPMEWCNALFDLMDRVSPFSYEEVQRIVHEELGRYPEDIFDSIETKSLATASIGQVHVAWLNGEKVALKVQRPNAQIETANDVLIMDATVKFIRFFKLKPLYWMVEPMSEFLEWTWEELDYRNEARYMHQMRHNARGSESTEKIPAVWWEYTAQRVLVLEFLNGVTVLDYLRAKQNGDQIKLKRLADDGFKPDVFAQHIINNFLGDAFNFGLFHADLHPANLMILPNNVVGYIDFGITGVLSEYSRYTLTELTLAYTRADLDKMTEIFLNVSAMGPKADVPAFRAGLERLASGWYKRHGGRVNLETNITRVMMDMLTLSKSTDIWPERDVIKYIRSSIALDGLITRFAIGFDVGAALEKLCDQYLAWGTRMQTFSYDRIFRSMMAGGDVMANGPGKMADVIENTINPKANSFSDTPTPAPTPAPQGTANPLAPAIVICLIAILLSFGGAEPQWGVNLFTAELTVLALALFTMIKQVVGPSRG